MISLEPAPQVFRGKIQSALTEAAAVLDDEMRAKKLEVSLGRLLHEALQRFSRAPEPAVRAVSMAAERALAQQIGSFAEQAALFQRTLESIDRQLQDPVPSKEAQALTLIDAALYPGQCSDYPWERAAQLKQALRDVDALRVGERGVAADALAKEVPSESHRERNDRYRKALLEIRDGLL